MSSNQNTRTCFRGRNLTDGETEKEALLAEVGSSSAPVITSTLTPRFKDDVGKRGGGGVGEVHSTRICNAMHVVG